MAKILIVAKSLTQSFGITAIPATTTADQPLVPEAAIEVPPNPIKGVDPNWTPSDDSPVPEVIDLPYSGKADRYARMADLFIGETAATVVIYLDEESMAFAHGLAAAAFRSITVLSGKQFYTSVALFDRRPAGQVYDAVMPTEDTASTTSPIQSYVKLLSLTNLANVGDFNAASC